MVSEAAEKEVKAADRLLNEMDFKGALSKYNKAIKLDPTCAQAYFGKAEASIGVTKVSEEEVIGSYKKAIELDPQNAFYQSRLGAFYLDTGKFDEAEQAYTKAAELDRENAKFYYQEFGFEYYNNATNQLDEEASNKEVDAITKRALKYILKSMELTEQDAVRILTSQ